ncbi:MAG: translation elongation factor Ts [Rhodothermaceae bacterium]
MSISAKQVKELRDKTGAGMMDCKKALTEANGDFEKAIEILRKKGASVAAKRAERSAEEGLVLTKVLEDNTGVMVEVNCETDFVAKSDDFVKFANTVLDTVVNEKPANLDELKALKAGDLTIADLLNETTGKVGEKVEISRFIIEAADNGVVVDYVHHGSKLGVLLRVDSVATGTDEMVSLAKDFAMQIAAMNPQYVSREVVPEDVVNKELEIYKEIAAKEGKPENILDKIAQGRLNKFFSEVCLVDQVSVKDNSKSVADFVKEFNAKNSAEAKVKLFHRFHLSDENK